MARAEFEAFTKSLLMNYRRSAARADPPLARCLVVKRVETGSLADRILLAQGDLLVSVNGQSAGTLNPKLWRSPAKIREYIFYSGATRERIELTAPGLDPGFDLSRTPEMVKATYKPESRDPEPLLELWEAGAWPALLELSAAALREGSPDTPILPLYGAALCETGRSDEGLDAVIRFLKEFARGWTVCYRGIAYYYVGLDRMRAGQFDKASEIFASSYDDIQSDRIADALVSVGQPRPAPPVFWTGNSIPGDYTLGTLEGEPKSVSLSDALRELPEGHVFLLCLLTSYRGNGPYNQFMERYRTFARDFKPFVGSLHVVTGVRDRYPDRPYYFEHEDKARAEKAPFELLFDSSKDVGRAYAPSVSPFVMAINRHGHILSEGEMDGMELWRGLVAANR